LYSPRYSAAIPLDAQQADSVPPATPATVPEGAETMSNPAGSGGGGGEPDLVRPSVSFSPPGGTYLSPAQTVRVEWCDDRALDRFSRQVTFRGIAVTATYVRSSKAGFSHGMQYYSNEREHHDGFDHGCSRCALRCNTGGSVKTPGMVRVIYGITGAVGLVASAAATLSLAQAISRGRSSVDVISTAIVLLVAVILTYASADALRTERLRVWLLLSIPTLVVVRLVLEAVVTSL
jgi:hypothetical protein